MKDTETREIQKVGKIEKKTDRWRNESMHLFFLSCAQLTAESAQPVLLLEESAHGVFDDGVDDFDAAHEAEDVGLDWK